jgi:hypothetical protein
MKLLKAFGAAYQLCCDFQGGVRSGPWVYYGGHKEVVVWAMNVKINSRPGK